MKKCRVLIVEDEIIASLHIKSMLQHLGYQVVNTVATGEEAIVIAETEKPDLILMDIILGGKIDGIKAATEIRGKFEIPIIYLTSYNDEETVNKAKITEPLGFLVKPVENNALRNSIELALYKHQAEKKLKESEERYKALFNCSLDIICIHDFSGNFLDANTTAINISGYSINEIRKLNIKDVLVPDQIPRAFKVINEIKLNKIQKYGYEFKFKDKKSNIITVESLSTLIFRNGEPFAIQVLARDITQRKLAEAELADREMKLRSIIEAMTEGLILSDNNHIIQFVNKPFTELFGYLPNEIIGTNVFESIPCDAGNNLTKSEDGVHFDLNFNRIELKIKNKSGNWLWTDMSRSPVLDEKGKIIGYVATYSDISSRKKAEEASSHLAAIVQSSQDAVLSISLDGIIISWNRGAEKMFGYPADEVIEKNISFLVPFFKMNEFKELLNKLSMGESVESFDTVRLKKDGKLIHVSITESPIKNSSGEIIYASSIIHDLTKRKQDEEELRISQQKYRDIFEFAPIGIYQSDPNGKILTANKAFADILGFETLNEILGLNIFKDICYYNQIDELTKRYFQTGEATDVEILWKGRNDDPVWVLINSHSVKDISGKIISFEGFVKNINRRKKTEEVLIEREQSYRTLVETSSDAIYVMQDEHLLLVNNAWQRMFGYTSEEACSDNFDVMRIIAEKDIEFIRKKFTNYIAKKELGRISTRYEMTGISKKGNEIQLEVSASEIVWKGKRVVQGIYRDITARKKAEEEILKLSQAVQQSPVTIIILDSAGCIEYVNPKFTQMSGYSPEDVRGKLPSMLAADIMPQHEKKLLRETIYSGKEWKGELQHRKKDGNLYWESTTISPIKTENGIISHFLVILQDITERKMNEEQLIKAKEEAEKSDRLKTEFLAQMSHEIRTPLNNILTYTSILKDEFEDKLPSGLENTFSVINSSSQRLIRTIELILNLSRIQTGNFDTHFKEFDIDKELLEDLIIEFYSRAKIKNLCLTYENKAQKTKVICDHYSLEQLFLNLIDNAIKYTPQGEIKILVSNDEENFVNVSIKDSGIGISQEFIPHLFNPFSQEDMGITRHFEGTGLGLALVKKYAEINKAVINVETEKGKGSNFILKIPALT